MVDWRSVEAAFQTLVSGTASAEHEFRVAQVRRNTFVARSHAGHPSVFFELAQIPEGMAIEAGGLVLRPFRSVVFRLGDREWTAPTAMLSCTQPELSEGFLILAAALIERLEQRSPILWVDVWALVDEWQALLAQASTLLSAEDEQGLWGELKLLAASTSRDRLAAGYVAGESEDTDFDIGSLSIEVKTARIPLRHHFSVKQTKPETGELQRKRLVLSLHVQTDSAGGESVSEIAKRLLASVSNPARLLQQLLKRGFDPVSGRNPMRKFSLASREYWFNSADVPHVTKWDDGVLSIRYVAALDQAKSLTGERLRDVESALGVSFVSRESVA